MKKSSHALTRFSKRSLRKRINDGLTKIKAFQISAGNNPTPISPDFNSNASSDLESVSEFEKSVKTRCESRDLSVYEALRFVDDMAEMTPLPSTWIFNRLIGSLWKMNQCSTVVSTYARFSSSRWLDFKPDICTLTIIIQCLCRSSGAKSGFSVLPIAIKTGLRPDSHMTNALLAGLCKEGSLASAMELFEKISRNRRRLCDEATYATIINALCKARETRRAVWVLKMMAGIEPKAHCFSSVIDSLFRERRIREALSLFRDVAEPDSRSYSIVIRWLCRDGRFEEAVSQFESMVKRSVKPDVSTFASVIAAMCRLGRFEEASWLYDRMMIMIGRGGSLGSAALFNVLAVPLCRIGREKDAIFHFEAIPKPGVRDYNSFLRGLCHSGLWDEAEAVLEKMRLRGVSPDGATYSVRFDALSEAGRFQEALALFEEMVRENLRPRVVEYGSFLRRLCRSGWLRDAERVFNEMAGRNVSPNAKSCFVLLDGLSKKGMMDEALRLVDVMTGFGIRPSVVTYAILMKGFCVRSEVGKAREVFERMVSEGFSPNSVAYCTLVDGYVRVGRVNAALKLLREMVEKGLTPNNVAQSILRKVHAKRLE